MSNLVTNKTEENNHLRGKSKFYVAGWVANRECENPQVLPESCKGDIVVERWHEEYLSGYGDSLANGECLNPPVED
tara:strand:- start:209 stop:436 length:228 start_codon:yes stop_codon:yes gene_type:complete